VAVQGALAVAGDVLLAPTGRAVPAAFSRSDGRFRYFHLQANRGAGGSEVAGFDQYFVNGGTLFAVADGSLQQVLGAAVGKEQRAIAHAFTAGVEVAVHPRWVVYASGNRLRAIDRRRLLLEREVATKQGPKKTKVLGTPAWSSELAGGPPSSLIVAGDWVLAGGNGTVTALDIETGQSVWKGQVEGTAYSLAVAGGRLLAGTDRGTIHCFGQGEGPPTELAPAPPSPPSATTPGIAAAAEEILRQGGFSQGYCLDLGSGDGQFALELARRTNLRIYAVDADPAKVAAARAMLHAAGLYGVRVTVHQADLAGVPYPNYFADLVVSGRSVTEGADAVPWRTVERVLRPYGGVACLGRPGAMRKSVRGALEGAGEWTHLYADSANTVCSEDLRLQSPLRMLWFRDTDLAMPSRHGRAPSPLVAQGRMFVEGLDAVRAVNAYNGSVLWEVPMKGLLARFHQDHLTGVAATGGNMCLGPDRLFVHTGDRCLSFDVATGRQSAAWEAPRRPDGKPGVWGFIAYADGTLFGSLADETHVVKESWNAFLGKLEMRGLWSESTMLFAMDAGTGVLRWTFRPRHSIRHNAIAIGGGRVFLIDRPAAAGDTPRPQARDVKPDHPPGRLVCLDAQSGKVLWENGDDIFGTLLALGEKHGILLMSYQPTRFPLASERGGRMAAFRAADGTRLWDQAFRYHSRPVLIDRAIYAEPGQWDLLTGRRLAFDFSRSYGCGILAGARRLLVYRSATLGYCDLEGARTTENYGGIRPGCWINAIPAGGLVLLADAASWCTCSYLNQATIALEPAPPRDGRPSEKPAGGQGQGSCSLPGR
jgi:outer membrane protein assembly factor BamB